MAMADFAYGSGFSVGWFNHWIIGLTGTLVVITAAALVVMLVHRFELINTHEMSGAWIIAYVLFVIMVLFLFLGFLNNFWI